MQQTWKTRRGFTLVELLVVVGIIALLIGILMPVLSSAQRKSYQVKCMSNLRTNYQFMLMYANNNKGWWAPKDLGDKPGLPKEGRWPVYVFPQPPNPNAPRIWNPPTMYCPADYEPAEEHSYILNNYVLAGEVRFGKTGKDGLSSSDIILMGEKKSPKGDYYMELKYDDGGKPISGSTEFWELVEEFRHGIRLGSNYLMMDGRVELLTPKEALQGMDPWDFGKNPALFEPKDPATELN